MCEVEFWEVFLLEGTRVFSGGALEPPADCQLADLEMFVSMFRA
jgi:hypothetical protein